MKPPINELTGTNARVSVETIVDGSIPSVAKLIVFDAVFTDSGSISVLSDRPQKQEELESLLGTITLVYHSLEIGRLDRFEWIITFETKTPDLTAQPTHTGKAEFVTEASIPDPSGLLSLSPGGDQTIAIRVDASLDTIREVVMSLAEVTAEANPEHIRGLEISYAPPLGNVASLQVFSASAALDVTGLEVVASDILDGQYISGTVQVTHPVTGAIFPTGFDSITVSNTGTNGDGADAIMTEATARHFTLEIQRVSVSAKAVVWEVQRIRIVAQGDLTGQFYLSFLEQETSKLSWDTTEDALRAHDKVRVHKVPSLASSSGGDPSVEVLRESASTLSPLSGHVTVPFDATEEQMKEAIEMLQTVGTAQVILTNNGNAVFNGCGDLNPLTME